MIVANQTADIRTALTNTTQEGVVLSQADGAALVIAGAWETASAAPSATASAFVSSVQDAVAKLFRQLIDTTTTIEVEYLRQRLH